MRIMEECAYYREVYVLQSSVLINEGFVSDLGV